MSNKKRVYMSTEVETYADVEIEAFDDSAIVQAFFYLKPERVNQILNEYDIDTGKRGKTAYGAIVDPRPLSETLKMEIIEANLHKKTINEVEEFFNS